METWRERGISVWLGGWMDQMEEVVVLGALSVFTYSCAAHRKVPQGEEEEGGKKKPQRVALTERGL